MLVVGRSRGKEVMIGDHSVITVVSISNEGVKLGFETRDRVRRVDSPSSMVEAAKIKARMSHAVTSRREDMEKMPIYVAAAFSEGGAPQVKAAFSQDKASYPGAEMSKVDDTTHDGPAFHQFLVVRCATPEVVSAIKTVYTLTEEHVYLDEMEHEDATLYVLFVQATDIEEQSDVYYLDLTK